MVSTTRFRTNCSTKTTKISSPSFATLCCYSNELNNADRYLKKLIENFRRSSNSCTLNLPVESEHFDLEIDDARI